MKTTIPEQLSHLLSLQDGVITVVQARTAGLTRAQMRTLVDQRGWTRPARGLLAAPEPKDPFRTSVRAALLTSPLAVAAGITAARLHVLWVPRLWTPAEKAELIIAAGITHHQRRGMQRRSGLHADEQTITAGFAVTTLERTVHDLAVRLRTDDLVCLLDSALRAGWRHVGDNRARSRMREALPLADARSESPLETRLRLILTRAGLPPESLQYKVKAEDGRIVARLDMAYPSVRLGIEADGREVHELPEALLGDRRRQNDLQALRWTILRFTWDDVVNHPAEVIARVRWTLRNAERAAKAPF